MKPKSLSCNIILILSLLLLLRFEVISQNEIGIAKTYLLSNSAQEKLEARDISEMELSSGYLSPTTGWYHMYFDQTYRSVRVYNSQVNAVLKEGKIIHSVNNFVRGIDSKALLLPELATVSAKRAVGIAANSASGMSISEAQVMIKESENNAAGTPHKLKLTSEILSSQEILANLFWVPNTKYEKRGKSNSPYTLAWVVQYLETKGDHAWNVQVDAVTGDILEVRDEIIRCSFGPSCSEKPGHTQENYLLENQVKATTEVASPNTYTVFDYPLESPLHGSRSMVTNPYERFVPASTGPGTTNGWHNDGTSDYTGTRGNNVFAKEDTDNNNTGGNFPSSATLDFNFDYSQSLNSSIGNQNAAITNLFYWNNLLHDVLYEYGFDEPSGNFQANNLSRGGQGNDFVFADAQDGGGINNANFFTPADGTNGRMQMYLWNSPASYQPDGDFDNGIIAHEYGHGWSTRLTGGPATSTCLYNAEQGGEGWSDYLALMTTTNWAALSPDVASANISRGIGTYALGQPLTGVGIRPEYYSYDMATVNPTVTYGEVNLTTPESFPGVHGVGAIWATALWDMTWEIILQDNQITGNIYDVPAAISDYRGNIAALKLVHESLRLQPCSPSLLDSRDAILKADQLLFDGRYQCSIAKAFARRGFGYNASTGSSTDDRIVTEDFTLFGGPYLSSDLNLEVCSGVSLGYTASTAESGTSFSWTRATVPGIQNPAGNGTGAFVNEALVNTTQLPVKVNYSFTVSPVNTCSGTAQQVQYVEVTVFPKPTPVVADFAVCQNSSISAGEGLKLNSFTSNLFSGIITLNSPQFIRPSGNNTTVYVGMGSSPIYYYKEFYFVSPVSGPVTFETTAGTFLGDSPYDTYLALYQESFNPQSPATNFLHGDDDSGTLQYASRFTHNLVEGQVYILVVTTYYGYDRGSFTVTASTPMSQNVGQWFLASSGGSALLTGNTFNPVAIPGTGVTNTASLGNFPYYLAHLASPQCREPVRFVVTDKTVGAPQVLTSPANNINGATVETKGFTVTASNHLQNSQVIYNAGRNVLLQPGFSADNSNVFQAYIGTCLE